MNRLALAAALIGFLGVGFGAFGAHGLEGRLSVEALGWWETATFYALIHAVAALALAIRPATSSDYGGYRRAGWAFLAGAVLFAGSLYAMALGAPSWSGAITPLGGLCFLGGWTMVALAASRSGAFPDDKPATTLSRKRPSAGL
jgi:uncharacterized membrane protein YgdD (TMEM256/DUF423 family)